jgi:signal transduction histidine kinase
MVDWLQRHAAWVDALVALTIGCMLPAISVWAAPEVGDNVVALLSCALAGVAFGLWRVMPVATIALVVVAITALGLSGAPGGPAYAAPFAAAFTLACVRGPRIWLPWTVAAAVGFLGGTWIANGVTLDLLPVVGLLLLTPKLADDFVRTRRLRMEALEARLSLAEQETLRRVAEERLNIAREVHDVVGHGLATITLRAGVADRVADRDPAEVRGALRAIREVSADSLAQLSVLLGVLRADGAAGMEHAPTPSIDAVPGLVAGLRDAGLDVGLEIEEDVQGGVPEVVGAAVYRIVQESLTNAARHAGPRVRADVRVLRRNGAVEVDVRDDGRGAAHGLRTGGGLTGMRERATALGGSFEAGGAAGGGFRVHASLPVVSA